MTPLRVYRLQIVPNLRIFSIFWKKRGRENAKKRERIVKMSERGERKKEYRRKETMLKSEFRDFSRSSFRAFSRSLSPIIE
jgi:hypothetical protein